MAPRDHVASETTQLRGWLAAMMSTASISVEFN